MRGQDAGDRPFAHTWPPNMPLQPTHSAVTWLARASHAPAGGRLNAGVRPRRLVEIGILLLLPPLLNAASSRVSAKPPMPYADWAACPFECCVYRMWSAVRPTVVLSARSSGAPVLYRLNAGDRPFAITGVVVTTRPGRIEILEPMTLGKEPHTVSLRPGDLIYTLHYLGEGYDLFWFNGRTYSDQIHWDGIGMQSAVPGFRFLEQPTIVWWVKLRNASGQVGWSNTPWDFTDNSACS